jgi:hypothetical protein
MGDAHILAALRRRVSSISNAAVVSRINFGLDRR